MRQRGRLGEVMFGWGLWSGVREPVRLGRRVWRRLRRWQALARERRQLAMLDEAALKDLGLSRADAVRESERPFWDDPLR